MAKKYTLFALIAILLVGCGASPKATPTTTNTPTAIPTNTSTPTATATSTPTAIPTNTPTPTATSSPSPTLAPTPSVPLHAVLVTINDFMTLSELYQENPVLRDKALQSDIIIDSCEETFFGTDEVYGNVTMSLVRYINDATAKEINEGMKLSVTLFDTSFQENERIPDNFWAGKTLANGVYASATYHDVLIWLRVEDFSPSVEPEKFAKFALLLINNQIIRLEDGGY